MEGVRTGGPTSTDGTALVAGRAYGSTGTVVGGGPAYGSIGTALGGGPPSGAVVADGAWADPSSWAGLVIGPVAVGAVEGTWDGCVIGPLDGAGATDGATGGVALGGRTDRAGGGAVGPYGSTGTGAAIDSAIGPALWARCGRGAGGGAVELATAAGTAGVLDTGCALSHGLTSQRPAA
jgi:hypothetical protein